MNTKMIEVINQLQTVAPEIWNAAITDSYLSAGSYACGTALFLSGFVGIRKYTATILIKHHCTEDELIIRLLSGMGKGLSLFMAIMFAYEGLSHLISAELHAYESLLQGFK